MSSIIFSFSACPILAPFSNNSVTIRGVIFFLLKATNKGLCPSRFGLSTSGIFIKINFKNFRGATVVLQRHFIPCVSGVSPLSSISFISGFPNNTAERKLFRNTLLLKAKVRGVRPTRAWPWLVRDISSPSTETRVSKVFFALAR